MYWFIRHLSLELTAKEKIVYAEILQALHLVEANQSFASAAKDTERFKRMFPDSEIAKGYKQSSTKVAYTIKFGIKPYVSEILEKDMQGRPFVFHFDETTTSQVKKQYDGYVTYFSLTAGKVITQYCGSLFLGHCTAENLVDHFFEFMLKIKLCPTHCLSLGMDGPSVNLKFLRELLAELDKQKQTTLINVGTCTLHIVNNAFAKGMGYIDKQLDFDQLALDINFFFKLSAARREDLSKVEEITDVAHRNPLKHVQTRWLSIERVLVRLNEQYPNLRQYFLVDLPKMATFKGMCKSKFPMNNRK